MCYVLPRVNEFHPIAYDRHELIWYPETSLSMLEQVSYQCYVKSVVTENPWIISSYPQEHVRIWDEAQGWVMPAFQTRGLPVDKVYLKLLGITHSIPSSVLDGGAAVGQLTMELEISYKIAQAKH